jgi:microcystin degradation protein MlrC
MGDALMSTLRVGVASIVQETNTFSPKLASIDDFESQGIEEGEDIRALAGTNTEAGGAVERLVARGVEVVPLIKAWAMSSGRLTGAALDELVARLRARLRTAGPLDGLVLSLHGAMSAETADDADLVLLDAARNEVGESCVIGVCLDLHANVTAELIARSDLLIGYHTYPHVDQADTGARTADLVVDRLEGRTCPVTVFAKRPMLIPGEAQGSDGPFGRLRSEADRRTVPPVLDISLFPVQPWLDVDQLGSAVTATTDGDPAAAAVVAEEMADLIWSLRHEFVVDLLAPARAIEESRLSPQRPILLSQSSDSPTAGATGDSAAMVAALLGDGQGLRSYATVLDEPAVAACHQAGVGGHVDLWVGATLDPRFHPPVQLEGTVRTLGDESYPLEGPVFTGMEVSMGRYAVVDSGDLSVLLTERAACTFDPATFRHVGLPPEDADLIVIRSAHLFRAGFAGVAEKALILDLPGASTPRLESLSFTRAPRPLYPIEEP